MMAFQRYVFDYVQLGSLDDGTPLYSIDRTVDCCKECGTLLELGAARSSEHFCSSACAAAWAEALLTKAENDARLAEARRKGYVVKRRRSAPEDVVTWRRHRHGG